MFSLTSGNQYYLCPEPTDMRKGFDSLCGIVQNHLKKNPLSGEVFIFINQSRNRIKLLHWEAYGFTLYYKRLEEGTLEIPPMEKNTQSISISWTDLVMIIQGISLTKIQKRKRYYL